MREPMNRGMVRRRKRWNRIILLLLFIYGTWAFVTYQHQESALDEKKEQIEQLSKEATIVKAQYEELTYQIERLQDEDYLLELARKEYYMSLPGEMIFEFPK